LCVYEAEDGPLNMQLQIIRP